MIVIKSRRALLTDHMVFYPDQSELDRLAAEIAPLELLRVSQTTVLLSSHPNLIDRSTRRACFIDLTKSLEQIFREMNDTSRNIIHQAERLANIKTIENNSPRAREDFFQLYNDFVALRNYQRPLSRRRYEKYLDCADVFVSYLEDYPVCGHLIVWDAVARRATLIFSGSNRLNSSEQARYSGLLNRHLHWHEIQTYKGRGLEVYDLGGIGDGTNSVAKFKLSLARSRVEDWSYVFARTIGTLTYRAYSWAMKRPIHSMLARSRPRNSTDTLAIVQNPKG